MSTLFAVKTNSYHMEPIARRQGGVIYWINEAYAHLPDNITVTPVDNTAQGIHTVGDIKKAIETGDICPKEPHT